MKHFLSILIVSLVLVDVTSCGVFKARNYPLYYAGDPVAPGYTPEGIVESHVYPCSVEGPSHRRMIVYLPEDYYRTEERYPVFYLLHGARGHETAWVRKSNVLMITDSLWRTGEAEKCIVVMPNVNQYNNDKDYDNSRYKDCFESIFEIDGAVESAFVRDVVGYVDSHFRTVPSKESRAVAGLSAGALQSLFLSANHPCEFGYVGLYSPMCGIIRKPGPYSSFYSRRDRKMAEQFAPGHEPCGYYIYIGKADFFLPQATRFSLWMFKKGYDHLFFQSEGGHDWYNWNDYYCDMLGRVFH